MRIKKQAFSIFVILSFLVMVAVAHLYGQSVSRLVVSIPFKFVVSNTTLPAGEYSVEPIGVDGGLHIRSADGHASVVFVTRAVQARTIEGKGKLVFKRYESHYLLSQVWFPERSQGRELPKSRDELELAERLSNRQHASETVSIAPVTPSSASR